MADYVQRIADYCAKIAWERFQKDPKQFRQTIMDKDGEYHYCLCYNYCSTVVVHGIWNPKTGNHSVIRVKMA
jgi:hypothetical protein